jgi:signal recognition particle receptor subunit beta
MAEWNNEKKLLTLKVVYYGPALSGKTTNLIALHDLLQPELKGDMQVLETENDRTLFFDLLPLGITLNDGTLIKLKLYTVPGQVVHNSTRKAVLSRSDGVVFVADSQSNQSANNGESFNNLIENIQLVGLQIKTLPLVVQFNKRDLGKIVSTEEIEKRWSSSPWQLNYASALNKKGVLETFSDVLTSIHRAIDEEYKLNETYQLSESDFVRQVIGQSMP